MGNVKILDVTLRDGTYVFNEIPSQSSARNFVDQLHGAGINQTEIGYFRRANPRYFGLCGPTVCNKEYLSRLNNVKGLVVMVRPGDIQVQDLEELLNYNIAMVRFPIDIDTIHLINPHLDFLRNAEIDFALNITRCSEKRQEEIMKLGLMSEELGAKYVYVADSNGALFPDQVREIISNLQAKLDCEIGFHAHNNISLAFANTIAAIQSGATIVDSSMRGMGKGGNLNTELIAQYLNTFNHAKFDMEVIAGTITPNHYEWLIPSTLNSMDMRSGMDNLNISQRKKEILTVA